jgi:predicted DsbA family dithiol-disulfide isomerase
MKRMVRVEISVDLVCPWCLIGLRQFQRAREGMRTLMPQLRWDVHWRGVQLLPHVPQEGFPFHDFYLQRLGGPERLRERQAQVRAAAARAGVSIDYDRIAVMPNTADAHRMLQSLDGDGARQEALAERLLCAYFERGEDIGNADVLRAHGAASGLSASQMDAALLGARMPFASNDPSLQGVPCFVFDDREMLSGAQPAPDLVDAVLRAIERARQA